MTFASRPFAAAAFAAGASLVSVALSPISGTASGAADTTGLASARVLVAATASGAADTTGSAIAAARIAAIATGSADTTGTAVARLLAAATATGAADTTGSADAAVRIGASASGAADTVGTSSGAVGVRGIVGAGTADTFGSITGRLTPLGQIAPFPSRVFLAVDALEDPNALDPYPVISLRHPAGARLDYTVDFTPVLPVGADLVSYSLAARNIAIDGQQLVGKQITIMANGGAPMTRASVVMTATDNQVPPRTYSQVVILQVVRVVVTETVA